MPLDIKAEAAKLKDLYSRAQKFNALIAGKSGAGKTYLASTCPNADECKKEIPVHIDSFCPGGLDSVSSFIKSGLIVPDTRWERDDPLDPWAFMEWESVTEERIKEGYFDHVGTYFLDELTTFSWAITNAVLKRNGRIKGKSRNRLEVPLPISGGDWKNQDKNDWVLERTATKLWIERLLNLPCNVIVTAHLVPPSSDSGTTEYLLDATGKNVNHIPQIFSEFYTLDTQVRSTGVDRWLLTAPTSKYPARSRLSGKGLLENKEEPNIANIMRKVGLL